MGFMAPAEPATEYRTVATAMGSAQRIRGSEVVDRWAKARLFILEDRRAVLVTPAPAAGQVVRQSFDVLESSWAAGSRQLTAVTDLGDILVVDGQGCGCNMGVIASAGPTDEPYRLVKVRAPEWHT